MRAISYFPDWLGEWFYEELTYEERGVDGKWRKPGKGANEAFDLFCYAHAVAVLRGLRKNSRLGKTSCMG